MDCHQRNLISRLNRVEGQIRGVRTMIEDERACEEIIVQLSAISSAVANIAKEALKNHINHCLIDAVKAGDYAETLNGVNDVLDKFTKMK